EAPPPESVRPHAADLVVRRRLARDRARHQRVLVLHASSNTDQRRRRRARDGRPGGSRCRDRRGPTLRGRGARHARTAFSGRVLPGDRAGGQTRGRVRCLAGSAPAAVGPSARATALRPVETMSRTARRISAQDLTRRLPLRGTSDELDHLAETLNAMFARLDAAFTHVRRFAVDAAHELRTPLTVLKGGIEVALRAE